MPCAPAPVDASRAVMEEVAGCPVRRLPCVRKALAFGSFGLALVVFYLLCRLHCALHKPLESTAWDIAEVQLNHTGLRQDPRLHWKGGPALGRSFLHGPELDNGQLRVRRDGIYRLHIQVTLMNCSSTWASVPQGATLAVGICSPATHAISLLRLHFQQSCTVASQRLTPLAHGDTLCADLTPTLLPSPNTDETFFGIQWVHP